MDQNNESDVFVVKSKPADDLIGSSMIPTKNQPSSNHDDVNLIGLDPPLTSSKLHIPLINDSDPHMQKFSDFKFDEMVSAVFAGKKEVGKCLKIIIYACFILSGGILYLLCRWFPKLQTALFTRPCSLREATHIFVTNSFRKLELVKVQNLPLTEIIEKNGWPNESPYKKYMHNSGKSKESSISIFDYRFNRFILDPKSGIFIPINKILISCLPIAENNTKGLKNASVEWAKTFLGSNLINLPEKGYGLIFWEEVLHPFNVFQLLCIIWWACTEYFQYSVVIFLMSGFSMLLMVFETRKNMIKMNKMTRFECPTRILRDGIFVEESSAVLVPGDLIVLDENIETLPCDGILVNGDAIMDECMLTGETIPVTKIDIDDEQYKSSKQNESFADQFLLHSGTRLLRCRSRHGKPTMLLVTNTGFHTTKGNLIQSILFPRPNNFRFYRDSMIFIGIIAFIASFGFIFALISFIRANSSVQIIVERAFDAIAIILPPALPASMAVGTIFAIKRLEKRLIFCISPPRINVSSKINTMCFDKTGTMTEDGLEIFCVIPTYKFKGESNLTPTQHLAENIEFIEIDQKLAPVKTTTAQYIFKDNEPVKSCTDLPYMQNSQALHLLKLMATCHNIKKVNGRLLGDSLDLSMLEFTGWTLEESIDMDESIMPTILRPPVEDIPDSKSSSKSSFFDLKPDSFESNAKVMIEELGIIRHFDFSAALRRMSVVVRNVSASDKNPILYTKGSPEVIYNICDPHTLPENYFDLLEEYARNGYRVIACAQKICPHATWLRIQKMEREEVETEMNFLGFIIFENRLKDATKPTLTELKNADITSLMVTGDNILTAISVARASGLISENATVFYPELSAGCQFINHNNVRWKCIDEVVSEFDSLNLRPVSSTDDEFELVLAVTGDFFNFVVDLAEIKTDDFETDEFSKNYLQDLMKKCSIYARMSPNQKQLLVEILQNQDRIVGFCGDGANDCGALKASNVGISLSQAEASVAAPFTSQIQDISCVPMLLKEGRASLVTSLCCFKFISLYGMIQFSSLIFIYTIPGSFSNGQFCVLDILLIVPLGSLITLYGPAEHLSKKQPEAKLVSPKMLTNVIGHIFLQLAFQFLAFKGFTYYSPSAFTEFDPDEDDTHHPTITGQFLYSSFIYIASAIVFSVGRPFRQAVYWPLYFYAIFVTFLMIFMTFFSSSIKFLANMMNFVDVDYHKSDWFYRRVGIVVFALLYFVTAFFMDRIIFNRLGRALEFAFSKNRVTRKS